MHPNVAKEVVKAETPFQEGQFQRQENRRVAAAEMQEQERRSRFEKLSFGKFCKLENEKELQWKLIEELREDVAKQTMPVQDWIERRPNLKKRTWG